MNGTLLAPDRVPRLQAGKINYGETQMNTMLLKLYVKFQDLMNREEGQDLVEYALILALIALGATVAMKALATAISTEFTNITTRL